MAATVGSSVTLSVFAKPAEPSGKNGTQAMPCSRHKSRTGSAVLSSAL